MKIRLGHDYPMTTNLPNCEQAFVPAEKLNNYLLSETHVIGRAKAKYFQSIGYTTENSKELADELLVIARSGQACQEIPSDFGTKYVIDGLVATPMGKSVKLRTIWVIDSQNSHPRFVTAYPV